jgi:thiol:disulfide interchange protein DsbC
MVDVGERVLFVSYNGRYVVTGPAWDLWHEAKLTSLEEGARLAARVDLKRLGLDPKSLGALDLGSGKEDVLAFVDPRCTHCRGLLEKLPGLAEHYRFQLVPLPVAGPDSETAVVRLDCLTESDPDAARKALLAGDVAVLPEAAGTCGQAPAQRALVTARLLGIRGVPYLIAPDGRGDPGSASEVAWLVQETQIRTPAIAGVLI